MPRSSEFAPTYEDFNPHMSEESKLVLKNAKDLAINLGKVVVTSDHILFACLLNENVYEGLLPDKNREWSDYLNLDEYVRDVAGSLETGKSPVANAFFGLEAMKLVKDARQNVQVSYGPNRHIEPFDLYQSAAHSIDLGQIQLQKTA